MELAESGTVVVRIPAFRYASCGLLILLQVLFFINASRLLAGIEHLQRIKA
jgi:hypothetical protein